jgi:BirA family biotin operon repressor/biotin-[acetyl-CoA-carboxylase] ligase
MAKILECYRKRSFLIGRQVVVVGNETELLRVIGIGDKGELIVQDSDGNRRFLSSGEVSVKEWNEYES